MADPSTTSSWGPGAPIKSAVEDLAIQAREQQRAREAGKLSPLTLESFLIPPEHRRKVLQEQPDD